MRNAGESVVFSPSSIGPLKIRNRTIRSAAFEGMCPGGRPSKQLVDYHRSVAAGGVGMTTMAYVAVSPDGRTFFHQSWMDPDILDDFKTLTDAVHREGCAASVQLGHGGYMADSKVIGGRPVSPSGVFNFYGLVRPKIMSEDDINRTVADFARSVGLAAEAGFDAVEIQVGHGYLISQFLSPITNHRRDGFGGALENRARMMRKVMCAVREAAGPRMAVLVKTNLTDGFNGGMTAEEGTEVARMLEADGADALVLSGGFVSKNPMFLMRGEIPMKELVEVQPLINKVGLKLFGRIFVKEYPFTPAFFLDDAGQIRKSVKIPLVLVGGINSLESMERSIAGGIEFIAIARALIREPDFINKLKSGDSTESKCKPCNKCMAYMYNGPMRCPDLDQDHQPGSR